MGNSIPPLIWLSAIISVCLSAFGQFLMKSGMSQPAVRAALDRGLADGAFKAATNLHVLGGLGCYGLSMILWLMCLSRMPLTVAYPLVSLSLVLVIALSVMFGGERVALLQGLGIALIISGVLLVGVKWNS